MEFEEIVPVPDKTDTKHKYACALCSYSTRFLTSYQSHFATHSREKPFKCPECPEFQSKWQSSVKRHLKHVHLLRSESKSSRPFPCPQFGCNYAAKQKSNLTKHSKIHSDEKSFVCSHPNCTYSTNTKQNFVYHIRVHNGEKPWVCQFESCSYAAAQKNSLVIHTRTHTKERPYKCPETNCEYSAAQTGDLKKHGLTHGPKEGEERASFKCRLCEYVSKHKNHLSRHITSHTLEKLFKCDEPNCRFEAKTKSDLKQHKVVHSDEKHFACSVESCEFRSKYAKSLFTHLKTHSDERQYKCELCPFRGKTRDTVSNHIKNVHSDPNFRPFKCPEPTCDYAAKTKGVLNNHRLVHQVEQKYSCPVSLCDYKSARKSDVNAHKMTHETEKKFKCETCLFTTTTNRNLAAHMKKHNGINC